MSVSGSQSSQIALRKAVGQHRAEIAAIVGDNSINPDLLELLGSPATARFSSSTASGAEWQLLEELVVDWDIVEEPEDKANVQSQSAASPSSLIEPARHEEDGGIVLLVRIPPLPSSPTPSNIIRSGTLDLTEGANAGALAAADNMMDLESENSASASGSPATESLGFSSARETGSPNARSNTSPCGEDVAMSATIVSAETTQEAAPANSEDVSGPSHNVDILYMDHVPTEGPFISDQSLLHQFEEHSTETPNGANPEYLPNPRNDGPQPPGGRVPPLPSPPHTDRHPTGQLLLDLLALRPGMAGAPHAMSAIARHYGVPLHHIIRARDQALNNIFCRGFVQKFKSIMNVVRQTEGITVQWVVVACMMEMGLLVDPELEAWVLRYNGLERMDVKHYYREGLL